MAETVTNPQLLDVRNLRIEGETESGERVTLVDDVSFTLSKGEILGLVGGSVAGKSAIGLAMLVHARAGCRITGGQIVFRGYELRDLDGDGRRSLRGAKVAYVSNDAAAAFNPAHTLYDQVCEAALQHGAMNPRQARVEAVRLFRELNLPEPEVFGNRYPYQASRGQLQRALAAMAMVVKPDLIVFDEATTGLDAAIRVATLAAFRKLIRELGSAALFIDRDLALVAQIADRIMLLRDGKAVSLAPTAQILEEAKADYSRGAIAGPDAGQVPAAAADDAGEAQPILSVSDLIADYDTGGQAIDGVSFELMRGETLALVGESGSGKGVLIRTVLGLSARRAGDVLLGGVAVAASLENRNRNQHRRLQLLPRDMDLALNPRRTLLEIVGRPVAFYFGRSRRQVRVRTEELLNLVELPTDFLARRPDALTVEQRQRVCLARALAAEPDAIICDDATSVVDPKEAGALLRLLRRICDQAGVSFLFVTSDPGLAAPFADKIAILLSGQLVEYGPTQRVLSKPTHPYTELLLSSVPELRPDWLDAALRRRRKAVR